MRKYYVKTNARNAEKPEKRQVARALPPEEKFSYFCKFDELSGAMICPDVPLLALNRSCYQKLSDVFVNEQQ